MNEGGKKQLLYVLLIALLLFLSISIFYLIRDSKITGRVIAPGTEIETDPSIVLKLNFNDPKNPWKDYSMYDHSFSGNGNVATADKNFCKWYGCTNLSGYDSDYLNSTTKFKVDAGMSICFWTFINEPDIDGNTQYYYQIGQDGVDLKTQEENGWGMWTKWSGTNADIDTNPQDSSKTRQKIWTHYCTSFDPSKGFLMWRDSVVIRNSTNSYGSLKYTVGDVIKIGAGRYGDIDGYLDEFIVYNKSISQAEVSYIYDSTRLGTPPELDIYVKDIRYILPVDWNSPTRSLVLQDMPIKITIANAGTESTGNFDYSFDLDEQIVCSGKLSLNGLAESNVTCDWKSFYGFHKGYFTLDTANSIAEDNENNNKQRVYIPFLDRPWFHFSLSEWNKDYKPYCQNSNNAVAYSSCNWMSFFASESFYVGWNGEDVDPRGKKERENAMGCLYNNYVGDQCERAVEHAIGWGNRQISTYQNVQAIHELAHVGVSLDLVFPYLDQSTFNTIAKEYHDICQKITNLPNTRPDLDGKSSIGGDNGKGFGAGMATFCYSILGLYPENPTLIQKLDQQYWGSNIVDNWMDREKSYLQSYKDDPWSKYQEGLLYKTYSQPHLVENLWFEKKYGLNNIDEYQNALCSLGRESATELLDYTYDGATLRNDEKSKIRWVQRGDSNSYQHVTDGNFIDWDILLYYGLLCDDKDTKSALLWLRNKVFESGEGKSTYPASYLYKQLANQASSLSPSSLFPKVIFDNANDILTIRTNYTYVNDNVIQIDGGEEKGSGHSQAQGYYLYALGEPFLDYEQVPYEDDVRGETWKNGISLQNDVQTVEGQNSFYSANCGNAPLNQYYGMSTCPVPTYPKDYPNHRHFPLQYGGDLEDYIGTNDANFAGVYVYRPYKNADPVKEYFVKFGDLLAKRTVINNNKEGKGVYHNFINVYNEFTETRNGNDLTFTRNNKNLDINLIYSNQSFNLGGGKSGINLCFAKTDCSGINRGSSQYRRTYLYTQSNNVDFILAHHWYATGNKKAITAIADIDKGLQQNSNIIIFDTNNDGSVSYADKKATGWALAYNDDKKEIGAFNTNSITIGKIELFSSNSLISAHLQRSPNKIILTVNTMERNSYIDYPKKATITIDAQELSNNSKFVIIKNSKENIKVSESGTKATFEVESGQNSDYYVITGGGVGTIPADVAPPGITFLGNDSTTNQSSYIKAQTDENANLSVLWGDIPTSLVNSAINRTFQTSSTVLLSNLKPNSTIYYNATLCDSSGNCISKASNFTTAKTYIPPNLPPTIASFQPSSTKIQYNFTTTVIFNITGSDPEKDKLTLEWYVNKTLNSSNSNLSYVFNNIGIFNITAILSDSFSNASKQWLVTIINDTQQAFPPTILKTGFSSPTLNTDIFWTTSHTSDAKIDYGITSSLGTSITDPKQAKDHMISLINLPQGTKYYFQVTSCNAIGCASSNISNFTTIMINLSKYDGSTTDFTKLDGDNITNLTIEKSSYGKINFEGLINITRTIDIGSYTNITSNSVFVDTINVPELNVPATITFYNLSYTNPRILRDGSPCSNSICGVINYTNSTITFNVTGFSTYTVEETPAGTTTTSSGGTSSGGGGSGGGGSGGGGFTYVCNYDWQCSDWSTCTSNIQTRTCNFVNVAQHVQETQCPSSDNPPATSQSCEEAISIIPAPNATLEKPIPISIDVAISIPQSYKKVKIGSNLEVQVLLKSSGTAPIDVQANYFLTDNKNKIFYQESEKLSLGNELSFTKSFKIPTDTRKGDYNAVARIDYGGASYKDSETFEVIPSKSIWSRLTARATFINRLTEKIGLPPMTAIAIVLSTFLLVFTVARKFSKAAANPALAELSIDEQELYKYVENALNKGLTSVRIKKILIDTGWKKETVEKVINIALRR